MSERSGRSFVAVLLIVFATAAALRCAWLTADPPTSPPVGIVWHDEGAWVHNARNRALWGAWRTDAWNPVFVAPVFTALEYGAFRAFGVGTWQARTVPVASGLLAVAMLGAGLAALAGLRPALLGSALLATNYAFVMWNRAALMESTMAAFIVASWGCYSIAERRPLAGFAAGVAVVLAWFTKAAAAFFLAALVLDASITLAMWWRKRLDRTAPSADASDAVRAAAWTLGGVAAAGLIISLAFVLPHWSDYQFYNWQMSVTRKPEYTVRSLIDRASWLPIVHDFFTRMWLVTTVSALGIITVVLRWRTARPAERLLVWWVLLGLAELMVHDTGNERRYIMFIPALVALTALVLGRSAPVGPGLAEVKAVSRWMVVPLVFFFAYLIVGSLLRLAFLGEIGRPVRLSAAIAFIIGTVIVWRGRSICEWLSTQRVSTAAAAALLSIALAGDLWQYWRWAQARTFLNHHASLAVGEALPDGTLVQGKLANGLALENRIRPIFIGHGFGNFDDRKSRADVRYILTYIAPFVGYEGSQILDVLDAYPNRKIIMTFDVAETATGHDRAALIDKFGTAGGTNGQTTRRADH